MSRRFLISKKKQAGFSIVELGIVLTVMAVIIGGLYVASTALNRSNLAGGITQSLQYMTSSSQQFWQKVRRFDSGFTEATLCGAGFVRDPLICNAGSTQIILPWDNADDAFQLSATADGSRAVILLGGVGMNAEICSRIAENMVVSAHSMSVGNITAIPAGAITGGEVVKAADGTITLANIATQCNTANPKIAFAFSIY
jgi:type II secretory pathway pseudopilin PulG